MPKFIVRSLYPVSKDKMPRFPGIVNMTPN